MVLDSSASSVAYVIALRDIAREIVLIDIDKGKCIGEAMDIRHGLSGIGTADLHAGNYSDCGDADLIIITAGRNRRPEETRLDLANENSNIAKHVVELIKLHYMGAVY